MANPTKADVDYSYSGFQAEQQVNPFPGSQLDNDLAELKRASDDTIDALADVRRSDGALVNGIVTLDSLTAEVRNSMTGTAATIEIGTVTTGAPGTDVIVTNVGTSAEAVLDITIPRGATGAAGEDGEAGDGSGDMLAATYDPTAVGGDVFARANHTGAQAISTVTGLQTALDAKQPLATSLTTLAAVSLGAIGLSLLAASTQAAGRTALGLGTAATVNTGTTSGTLKTLNADGGFTINTGAVTPSVAVGTTFGGTWANHYLVSAPTDQEKTGFFYTQAIVNHDAGLEPPDDGGAAPKARAGATGALYLRASRGPGLEYLTSTAAGHVITLFLETRVPRDAWDGGALINGTVYRMWYPNSDTTYQGGAAMWETRLVVHDENGPADPDNIKGAVNHIQGRWWPTGGVGYVFENEMIGSWQELKDDTAVKAFGAFISNDTSGESLGSGHTATGWKYILAGLQNRSIQYFGITGRGHADGSGRVRASSGSLAAPTYSFWDDTDTGLCLIGAGGLNFVSGGANIFSINSTGLNVASTKNYQLGTAVVIDSSRRFVMNGTTALTAANIADITHAVNTTGKLTGLLVWDTTNNRMLRSSGTTAAAPWHVVDGSATVTPA